MKINNKLIVAVSFVSSVVIIQIIIIKKLISKYKVINQLNYDLINERIRKLRERAGATAHSNGGVTDKQRATGSTDTDTLIRQAEAVGASAKAAVKDSIAGNKYYRAERTKVEDLLREYYDKIDSAKTIEAVEEFKKDGIAEIAKIKTSDEKDEESEASRNSSSKPEQSSIKRGGKQR